MSDKEESKVDKEWSEDLDQLMEVMHEQIYPQIFELEDEYPNHSALYLLFCDSIHMMLMDGWSLADLVQEVLDHHKHHEDEENTPDEDDNIH